MRNTLHKYPTHAWKCYIGAPQKIIPKSQTQAAVNNPNALEAAFHPAAQSTAHRAVGLRSQLAPHGLNVYGSRVEFNLLPE